MAVLPTEVRYDRGMTDAAVAGQSVEGRGAVAWLYLMLLSYFVVVPLGTMTHAATTDIRLYDIAFLGGALLLQSHLHAVIESVRRHEWLRRYFLLAGWLALSLLFVFFARGRGAALLAAGRIGRFVAYGAVAGSVMTLVTRRTTLYRLYWLFYALCIAEGVLSWLQVAGVVPYLFPQRWLAEYGAMPVGTLGPHHLQMGTIVVMAVAAGIGLLQSSRSLRARLFIVAGFGPLLFATFAVKSRSGWLGLAALACYVAFSLLRTRRVTQLATAALAVVLGAFLFMHTSGPLAYETAQSTYETEFAGRVRAGGLTNVSRGRTAIVRGLPTDIARHPYVLLTGTGAGSAVKALSYGSALHNNYLQVLVEAGIPGFIMYLAMLVAIWKASSRSYRETDSMRGRAVLFGFRGAFLVVLVLNLFNETFWMQYSSFSLTGQIMFLTAVALHPAWSQDGDRPLEPS